MKLINEKPEEGFIPFNLTLRVETREEAEQLHFMFRCIPICGEIGSSSNIRKEIRQYIEYRTDDSVGDSYSERYDKLKQEL
jgi:hypothetical protein